MYWTGRIFTLWSLVWLSVVISGCKQELSDPHTIDPIYIDLAKEYSQFDALVKKEEKNYENAQKEFSNTEPRSLDRKIQAREMEKASDKIKKFQQMAEYYRIRSELRRAYGKKEYSLSFSKDQPWPKQEDIDAYFRNKKLRLAPKKWSTRVPGSPHYDPALNGKDKNSQDKQPAQEGGH